MLRKLLLIFSGLLLAAVTAGPAYARPMTRSLSQQPQISNIPEVCAQAGTGYCLAGTSGPVVMGAGGYIGDDFSEYVLSGYCDNGVVTDGVHSMGKPCPFPNGSGLNSKYEGDQVIALQSNLSGACIGTDIYENANLDVCPPLSNGSGSNIWIQGDPVGSPQCGNNSYYLINVYWSARHGNSGASSLISGGSVGAQAYVVSDNPATSCWRYQES